MEKNVSLQRRIAEKDGVREGARSRQHKIAPAKAKSKKAQQSLETRDRLLDAAEELILASEAAEPAAAQPVNTVALADA